MISTRVMRLLYTRGVGSMCLDRWICLDRQPRQTAWHWRVSWCVWYWQALSVDGCLYTVRSYCQQLSTANNTVLVRSPIHSVVVYQVYDNNSWCCYHSRCFHRRSSPNGLVCRTRKPRLVPATWLQGRQKSGWVPTRCLRFLSLVV